MDMTLGRYVASMINEKEWNVSRLAKEAGLSPNYAGFIVNDLDPRTGRPPAIKFDTLLDLANALRVPYVNLCEAYQGRDPEGWRKTHESLVEREKQKQLQELAAKMLEVMGDG
jgi:DNA-binding Xre family transcriptional regulator